VETSTSVGKLSLSARTITVRGSNFATADSSQPAGTNAIYFMIVSSDNTSVSEFECPSIEVISSSELVCHLSGGFTNQAGSRLYMAVSSHGGFAMGNNLQVSSRKRATNEIPASAWLLVGEIMPSPVIITDDELKSIAVNTEILTIYGMNFDGSGETLRVEFSRIGNTVPECNIKSATDTEIVCELENLVEGTLNAVVYSFHGPSEPKDVAIVVQGESSGPQINHT